MQTADWSSLMARLNGMSNQFTKTDWKIVNHMKNSPEDFLRLNAQELAAAVGTSDASVIRFTQKVGYSGLSEFKFALQQDVARAPEQPESVQEEDLLQQDYKTLLDVLFASATPERLERVARHMSAARNIVVLGLDSNRHVAEMLAYKFSLLGMRVAAVTDRDSLKLARKLSGAGDLFLVISLSGERETIADALGDFVNNGSYTVLLSNHEKSLCAAYADTLLLIPKTNMLHSADVITREVSLLQLGDMIFSTVLRTDKRAFDAFHKVADFVSPAEE